MPVEMPTARYQRAGGALVEAPLAVVTPSCEEPTAETKPPQESGIGRAAVVVLARMHARTSGGASVQAAWMALLEPFTWEWFCTLTFRGEVHPEGADKRFRVLVWRLNRAVFGPRWWRAGKSVQWVRALEYQRRGVIHFHALMRGVGGADRFGVMQQWDELAGFARIYPPRSGEAVRRYCAKYVAKGGELDVGGGPWGLEVVGFGAPGGRESAPRSLGFVVGSDSPEWWGEVDRRGHALTRKGRGVSTPRVLGFARGKALPTPLCASGDRL